MLILGLLLVVLSGAAAVLLIAYNNGGAEQTVTMFGRDLADVTMMQAFVAGLVVALVFMLGLWMILSAGRRARENRSKYREARREAKAAARERDELAEQLRKDEDARHDRTHDTDVRHDRAYDNTDTMVTPPAGTPVSRDEPTRAAPPHPGASGQPAGAPPQPRHAASAGQQPVITNIKPGDSPTR